MGVLILALAALLQAPPPTGGLTVCAFDVRRVPLPGVEILLTRSGEQKTIGVTRPDGCIDARPATGTYRVVGRLAGFDNATRDDVEIARDAKRVELYFAVSPLCDCVNVAPPRSLREAARRADAVIHGRVTAGDATGRNGYRHAATVLRVFKTMPGGGPHGPAISILDLQYSGAPPPIDPGEEFVIFARWNPDENAFVGVGRGCCGDVPTAFLVRSGRVASAPPALSRYRGMPLEAFLDEVRRAVAPEQGSPFD